MTPASDTGQARTAGRPEATANQSLWERAETMRQVKSRFPRARSLRGASNALVLVVTLVLALAAVAAPAPSHSRAGDESGEKTIEAEDE